MKERYKGVCLFRQYSVIPVRWVAVGNRVDSKAGTPEPAGGATSSGQTFPLSIYGNMVLPFRETHGGRV